MKKLFVLLIWVSISAMSYGQKALTFEEARAMGIITSHLDSIYANSIDSDTNKGVFKKNQDEFISSYSKLLKDFGQYLTKNNFLWAQPTNGFNRIYFDKDGKIDYFLYSFRPNPLTKEQEKRFGELLNAFIQEYRFPLKASEKFVQCSPFRYMPIEK
jgi:hypothetical protein